MATGRNKNNKLNGFTLLELLVAMAIFAIMSVMAYGGLSNVISNSSQSEQALERLRNVQRTMLTINRDLTQIVKRDIRDEVGSIKSFLNSGSDLDLLIEFTRNGRRNPAELLRSHLQRVAYKLEEDNFIRMYWPHLDRVQGVEPYESVVLDQVDSVELRYLDEKSEWHDQWPPLDVSIANNASPPQLRAIEFKITLKDWGELLRLVRVDT